MLLLHPPFSVKKPPRYYKVAWELLSKNPACRGQGRRYNLNFAIVGATDSDGISASFCGFFILIYGARGPGPSPSRSGPHNCAGTPLTLGRMLPEFPESLAAICGSHLHRWHFYETCRAPHISFAVPLGAVWVTDLTRRTRRANLS